jgi:hypothetical protein
MVKYWRITNKGKGEEKDSYNSDDEEDHETNLNATDGEHKDKTTVKCYQCNKAGHYKTDCWDNPNYEGDIPECYVMKKEWCKNKKKEVGAVAATGRLGGNRHGTGYEILF